MKAIINGVRYDTDNAVLIGESGGGEGRSDFRWWQAGLYRTPRSGRYFIAGEGGPMTRFAERMGNVRGFGRCIIPLSESDAFAWAQDALECDQVENEFAHLIEE